MKKNNYINDNKQYIKKKKKHSNQNKKKQKPMEWNRRAEQGERGRRRACVLETLPCSRLQHMCCNTRRHRNDNTACAIISKSASTRSGASLETLVSSAGPS